jgi:hypothetical protein
MPDGSLTAALDRLGDELAPSDVRMLRELARESRLMALAAYPHPEQIVHRQRHRVRIRGAFVRDASLHLGLLADLARNLEARITRWPPSVGPDDLASLRRLSCEARCPILIAWPPLPLRIRYRRRVQPARVRLAFLADTIRHLELLDELARCVEGRLWDG